MTRFDRLTEGGPATTYRADEDDPRGSPKLESMNYQLICDFLFLMDQG